MRVVRRVLELVDRETGEEPFQDRSLGLSRDDGLVLSQDQGRGEVDGAAREMRSRLPHLEEALGHLEQAGEPVQLRLPPQAGVGRRRRLVVEEPVGIEVPHDVAAGRSPLPAGRRGDQPAAGPLEVAARELDLLLIDARHGIKDTDEDILQLLDTAAVSYQAVLTKADKISKSALEQVIAETKVALAKHTAAFPDVIAQSAEKGGGVDILRAEIARLIASAGR